MAQPVDFVGLNTFIYDPTGWSPSEQFSQRSIPTPNEEVMLGDSGANFYFEILQNHIGVQLNQSNLYSIENQALLQPFWYSVAIKNSRFSLQLPDPQTNAAPSTDEGRTRATASYFTALMLHRNGPYGWPTWKQIRVSENPLTRKQKKHSIMTYVEEPGATIEFSGPDGTMTLPQSYSDIKVHKENAVVSRFNPIRILASLEDEFTFSSAIVIYATVGNEMAFFDNFQPNRYFAVSEDESRYYENVKKLYLNGKLQSPDSELKTFVNLRYSETIYPSQTNVYKSHIRFRPSFDFTWRTDIKARMSPGTSQTDDKYYSAQTSPSIDNGFGFNIYYQNRWTLDASWNFDSFLPELDSKYLIEGSTGNGKKSFDDYLRLADTRRSLDSSSIYFPPIGGARKFGYSDSDPYSHRQTEYITNSAGGEGQLMNSYSLFADWRQVSSSDASGYASSIDEFLTASAFYARRHVVPSPKSVVNPYGISIPEAIPYVENDLLFPIEQNFGGSTKWQANTTRRKNSSLAPFDPTNPFRRIDTLESRDPFYDSYSDFALHTRLVAKDYTIVPEFKMSSHVEEYLSTPQLDSEDFGIFDVSGGLEGTSSSDVTEFYKVYSNSDFMKHFELIRDDHSGFIDPTAISLKCRALKKFIPYDGFYPSQRSLQLAKQFYNSYGDFFVNLQSEVVEAEDPTALIGEFSHSEIRILGIALYNYYEYATGGRARYYNGLGSKPRGSYASIANLDDETSTSFDPYAKAVSCEHGSVYQGDSSKHPDGVWDNGFYYDHIDKSQSGITEESNYGFMLQDSNRNCVYIQLIDSYVWDNFKEDHFHDHTVRNYMFPLADYSSAGSGHKQPLLLEDEKSIPFSSVVYSDWSTTWSTRVLAENTGGHDNFAPTYIPVIWVRADGTKVFDPFGPNHDPDGHVTANRDTTENIADAVNALFAATAGDGTPAGNLLAWFSRDGTFAQDWGYNKGTIINNQLDTTFPTTATQNWNVSAESSGPVVTNSGHSYDEEYFIKFKDNAVTSRAEDQRIILNYSYGISVSEVAQGDETELVGADGTPNHFGKWTAYNANTTAAKTVVAHNTDADPKYTRIQPMITPLFAPGVLFNTIKSGVACDYPIMTDNVNRVLATVSSSTESTSSFWMIGSRGALTGAFVGATDFDYFVDNPATNSELLGGPDSGGSTISDSDSYLGGSRFTTDTGALGTVGSDEDHNSYGVLALSRNLNANQNRGFNLRIPFEALVEPENFLANRAMVNQEPDNFLYFNKYLRMRYKAYWDGRGDTLYKKMAHNFLAEIPEFFLENAEFNSFKSLKQGNPNFGLVEQIPGGTAFSDLSANIIPMEYTMRVKMYRSTTGQSKPMSSNVTTIQVPQDNDFFGAGGLKETLTMYSRPSAFGPPSWDGYTEMTGGINIIGNDSRNGYNFPFTPPYYHGEAWADITFVPGRIGKHSLDEIIASSSVEYYRYWNPKANLAMISREKNANSTFQWTSWTGSLAYPGSSIGTTDTTTYTGFTINENGNWYAPQHPLFVNDNAMQLSASLNMFGKQEVAKETEVSDDFVGPLPNPNVTVVDQNETQWVIQTKFETPILNFAHISASGEQQIIEIDTTNFYANRDAIDTDGGSDTAQFMIPPLMTLEYFETYNDNRITIYDGETPYNLWFYNVNKYAPTIFNTITAVTIGTFLDADPNTKGHPNTIKIDLDTLGSDEGIRNKIHNVLESQSAFGVSIDPNNNTKLYITASLYGPSKEPEFSTTLKTVSSLTEPVILSTGSYDAGSLHHNQVSPSTTTRGMWHQYGLIPRINEGVYMEVTDIPYGWNKGALGVHGGLQDHTGSLADLVGFPKQKRKLGRLASSKMVHEAVVAIPFIIENGERKFFEIPRADITDAMNPRTPESIAGESIRSMMRKMKKYVFPRQFDFLSRPAMIPFAMYIFEFKHTFSKQDLSDMWQGISPKIGLDFEEDTAMITHKLLSSELLGGGSSEDSISPPARRNKNPGLKLNDRLRWMVFKVKQRAQVNYYDKVVKRPNQTDLEEARQTQNTTYNWPYDFFSLVELVKLDADVLFSKVEEVDDAGSTEVAPSTTTPTLSRTKLNPNLAQTLANSGVFKPGSVGELMNDNDFVGPPESDEDGV